MSVEASALAASGRKRVNTEHHTGDKTKLWALAHTLCTAAIVPPGR